MTKRRIRIDHPAGYFEYKYQIPEVDGNIICAIPVLISYQNANEKPTWCYTGTEFWVNCEIEGYLNFNMYVFYT